MRNAECGTRNKRQGQRTARGVARFHRDQGGAMLDYVLVLAVFVPLAVFVIAKLFEVLSDYFGMIAFYVTWPFL